jgi:hypothetical protein
LAHHGQSHAIVENSNGLLRSLINLNKTFAKEDSWAEVFHIALLQLNSMNRSFMVLEHGQSKRLITSPFALAYGHDPALDISKLLGPQIRDKSVKERQDYITYIQKIVNDYNVKAREDLEAKDSERTVVCAVGTFVLLRRLPTDKNNTSYLSNVYRVVDRLNRKVTISAVFGKRSVFDVWIGHLKPLSNSFVLQYLPKDLQTALGGTMSLSGRELPFELESRIAKPPPKRVTRAMVRQGNKNELVLADDESSFSSSSSTNTFSDGTTSSHAPFLMPAIDMTALQQSAAIHTGPLEEEIKDAIPETFVPRTEIGVPRNTSMQRTKNSSHLVSRDVPTSDFSKIAKPLHVPSSVLRDHETPRLKRSPGSKFKRLLAIRKAYALRQKSAETPAKLVVSPLVSPPVVSQTSMMIAKGHRGARIRKPVNRYSPS